jgi:hypothetical protein
MAEDEEISARFTARAAEHHQLLLSTQIIAMRRHGWKIVTTIRRTQDSTALGRCHTGALTTARSG